MKDLSEDATDLSYSAILFQCRDFSREVGKINEELDELLYKVRLAAIMGARNVKDAESMVVVLQIASAIERMAQAASEMVRLLDIGPEAIPFLPPLLTQADERIGALHIVAESTSIGRTIGDLQLENRTGMHVLAVSRRRQSKQQKWLYDIEGDFLLRMGDVLVVRGTDEGFNILREHFEEGTPLKETIEDHVEEPDEGDADDHDGHILTGVGQ